MQFPANSGIVNGFAFVYAVIPEEVIGKLDHGGLQTRVDALDVDAYFTQLAQLMKTNPPAAQDVALVARMDKIGLVPAQDYDPGKLGMFGSRSGKGSSEAWRC